MKKLLYSSIILGAGLFAFGIQGNNVLTVKAEDVVSAEPVNEPASEKINESSEPEQVTINHQEQQENQVVSKDDDSEAIKKDTVSPVTVLDSKTGNRINVSDGENPLVQVRPTDEKIKQLDLKNVEDPANDGDLLVPYTYHGNGAVYVLDDNGQPIPDSDSLTGYKVNRSEDIYIKEDKITDVSSEFTGEVYGVIDDKTPVTKKEKMLAALKREGAFYMEFRNHGYSTKAELVAYKKAFENKLGEIQALNDDGTPVVKTPVTETTTVSHSHHTSTKTQSNVQDNEALPLVVIAIRQAQLYTSDGKSVTDRGLSDSSVWMVDKVATINGQKMYRISANEWVAANDVI